MKTQFFYSSVLNCKLIRRKKKRIFFENSFFSFLLEIVNIVEHTLSYLKKMEQRIQESETHLQLTKTKTINSKSLRM